MKLDCTGNRGLAKIQSILGYKYEIAIPVTVPRSGIRTFSSLPSKLARYTPPSKSVIYIDLFLISSSRPIPS
jgi:hypothetical protein